MKIYVFLITAVLTFSGCSNQKFTKHHFDKLEFSFTNTFGTCFSMKLMPNNVVFVKRYFPWPIQTFRGALSPIENQKIDSFLSKIPFKRYDTSYYEYYEDGRCYQFYVKTDSLEKKIFVHSYSSPRQLDQFAKWMVQLKEHLSLLPVDTNIEFKGDTLFKPPKINDTIQYTVPTVEK